jgi:hypothetical protein
MAYVTATKLTESKLQHPSDGENCKIDEKVCLKRTTEKSDKGAPFSTTATQTEAGP